MRVIGSSKPKGAVKAKAAQQLRGDPLPAQPRRFALTSLMRSSKSIHVGTRKMVNYAWPG